MIKVSVIIPAYNAGQYIRQCIGSVCSQTLPDIQIICINDGSTDDTLAVMREFAGQDSRITVLDKPNTGYGHSMNQGMSIAVGEYIGIVEADDYVLPDMFRTLYSIADELKLDIVKSDFISFFDHEGSHVEHMRFIANDMGYYNRVIDPRINENKKVFTFPINTVTGIYRRAFLEEHNIQYHETPGASYQDNGFWFQTLCYAERLYFLDKAFYMNRRDNPNSSIYSKDKVYCMNSEYNYILKLMHNDAFLMENFLDAYCLKKFQNYLFTFNRIALEHKLMYIRKFSQEFQEADKQGELKLELFTDKERKTLQRILDDPDRYYMECIAGEVKRANKDDAGDLTSMLQASKIYKVGLIVTYIPRKIQNIMRCIKAHAKKA